MKRTPVICFLGILGLMCLVLSACQKEYSIETNVSLAAQGTLKDTVSGDCMPDSVVGTFYGGVQPGSDTAFVLVNVNVTNAGTYTIYTDVQNGFYFSDSGYFSTTGLNTIKLKPIGTPIIPGTFNFSITFDTSTCGFTVNVQDSTGKGFGGGGGNPNLSDTAWKFTGPVGSYNGPIDSAFTTDTVILATSLHILTLLGTTQATGDSLLQLSVGFLNGAITPGTYGTSTTAVYRFTDNTTGAVIYAADPTTAGVNINITIASYDAVTNIVKGTFLGTAQDAGGASVNIPSGSFTAKVQ